MWPSTVCKGNPRTPVMPAPVSTAYTSSCCNGGTEAYDRAPEPVACKALSSSPALESMPLSPDRNAEALVLALSTVSVLALNLACSHTSIQWSNNGELSYLCVSTKEKKVDSATEILKTTASQGSSLNSLAVGWLHCPHLTEWFSRGGVVTIWIPIQVSSQESLIDANGCWRVYYIN